MRLMCLLLLLFASASAWAKEPQEIWLVKVSEEAEDEHDHGHEHVPDCYESVAEGTKGAKPAMVQRRGSEVNVIFPSLWKGEVTFTRRAEPETVGQTTLEFFDGTAGSKRKEFLVQSVGGKVVHIHLCPQGTIGEGGVLTPPK